MKEGLNLSVTEYIEYNPEIMLSMLIISPTVSVGGNSMGFFDPVWKTDNPGKQNKAIAKIKTIDDDNLLFDIYTNAPLKEVRECAACRIRNKPMQKKILEQSSEPNILFAILQKYSSTDFSSGYFDRGTLYTAFSHIDDDSMLKELAQKGYEMAVYKIKDKAILFQMCTDLKFFSFTPNHDYLIAGIIGRNPFNTKEELIKLAQNTFDEFAGNYATEELISHGWMTAEEIALDNSFKAKSRIAAIKVTTDRVTLEALINRDESILIDKAARQRLECLMQK